MNENALPAAHTLWRFLIVGYLISVSVETPILVLALPRVYRLSQKLMAGVWLTACTYPLVVLVFPILIWQPWGRPAYLIVAETFAPLAECGLFWWMFGRAAPEPSPRRRAREYGAIIAANLASFGLGEWLGQLGWI